MASTLISNALEKMKPNLVDITSSFFAASNVSSQPGANSLVSSQQTVPSTTSAGISINPPLNHQCSKSKFLKNPEANLEKLKSHTRTLSSVNTSSSCSLFNFRNLICSNNAESSPVGQTGTSPSSSEFIDANDIKKFIHNSILIFLDCRTYSDFNLKHIKDSVHLNCRDKITKKRLQAQKLTVKDLISCEEIKNKLGSSEHFSYCEDESCFEANLSDMIILYDETTSDVKELQTDSNPLKIVKDNIKQCGYRQQCKILKGGFKQFLEICPEFCVQKEANVRINEPTKMEVNCARDLDQYAIENAVMTQITTFLYLGNELDAKNVENLEKENIFYILNVTKNIPFYHTNNPKFVNKRIAVNDSENQNLKQHFDEAIEFIDEAKNKNQKVLVHCQAGISRSPTIIIAYLMSKTKLSLNEAYERVRDKRPIIAPNIIFMNQLMDYESKLFGKSQTNNDSIFKKPKALSPTATISQPFKTSNKAVDEEKSSPISSSSNSSISFSSTSTLSSVSTPSTTNSPDSYFNYPLKINNDENKTIIVCN